MIKFLADRKYFCKIIQNNGKLITIGEIRKELNSFAQKYNCVLASALGEGISYQAACAEEDLLMIKLQCPEAIRCVYTNQ